MKSACSYAIAKTIYLQVSHTVQNVCHTCLWKEIDIWHGHFNDKIFVTCVMRDFASVSQVFIRCTLVRVTCIEEHVHGVRWHTTNQSLHGD